ncbi:hypothetical protein [Vibrio mimicus]|nr:hypothetical protein [Vibrio mimicus]EEY38771.1 hypothetical protein VII_002532 [Vibrio mimicus MB451]EGU20064.1 hypothetical protein SX4_1657 [Vibrio mimicus SX-4]ERM57029.1 hypothetical protein P780_06175 [Vibrio mimicus CAIM 1882]ERM59375.1 hypothetical protein P781_06195 [Vibrio mimicus CAIM 1883]
MKKPLTGSKSKISKVKALNADESPDNIHKIRKKIEDILLEREQKKLWDL